jgi:hypothetical protein
VGIPFSLSRKLFFLPTREVIEQSLKTQESCHLLAMLSSESVVRNSIK